jgi:hypothetical protein
VQYKHDVSVVNWCMPEEPCSPSPSPEPASVTPVTGDLREIEAARLADLLGAVLEDEGEELSEKLDA